MFNVSLLSIIIINYLCYLYHVNTCHQANESLNTPGHSPGAATVFPPGTMPLKGLPVFNSLI